MFSFIINKWQHLESCCIFLQYDQIINNYLHNDR